MIAKAHKMARKYKHPLCEDLVKARPKPRRTNPTVRQIAEEKERQMSSYMTHELRAPLTSIRSALGILEMQLNGRLAAEESSVLRMALRNAERLSLLINDIMDFTKVQAGKLTMEAAPVQPEEILQEAVDSLRAWAVSKGIRMIRVERDEPLPRVLADRKRMVQVVTNLLSNAIKFTPQGGKIDVSARLGGYDHIGTVVFRVKDSGPGIDPSNLKVIFKTFEQSALGAKTGSGTGLGLTLSKAMVELQGGRIWAESWKGLGASFLFTAPIFSGDTTAPVRLASAPVPASAAAAGTWTTGAALAAAGKATRTRHPSASYSISPRPVSRNRSASLWTRSASMLNLAIWAQIL